MADRAKLHPLPAAAPSPIRLWNLMPPGHDRQFILLFRERSRLARIGHRGRV